MQCTFQQDAEAHKYEPPWQTKGFRASGHFTEELGLFGGLTSLSALWNKKSLTQEMRFKWHASGSLSLNYFKMNWIKLNNTVTHI